MKRILFVLLVVLLAAATLPPQSVVHAQSTTQVSVNSVYNLNRYGFATAGVAVTVKNNGTTSIQMPDIGIGFGNLTSYIVAANVSGGRQWSNSSGGGTFLVPGVGSISAGSSSTFRLTVLLNGVVSHASNGSLKVAVLTSPSVSSRLETLSSVIQMPGSTQFVSSPGGFNQNYVGTNVTYTRTQSNVSASAASVFAGIVKQYSLQDFHPLEVFSAIRTISVGPGGAPQVQDRISFRNLGTTPIQTLTVAPLTSSSGSVTVEPASEPPLLNPVKVSLSSYGIDLTNSRVGFAVPAGDNYTIVYSYPLEQSYYTASGGSISLQIPLAPPIGAFVRQYTIQVNLPPGVKATQQGSSEISIANVSPLKTGTLSTGYALSIGWALDAGVPAASILFVILLLGLFVSRTSVTEEEETEEESATERVSAMIKAFEDKTSLINQLFTEIPNVDPNERNKAYFDELRGRLDAYRSRALQRLNEVKQKSTTQKFFDLLNQLHTTEREVDRAAKDTLNLYEQYYTNRMRKEVFDRLLPSYRKRLEKGLDQLSEQLHVAQRESKLL